MRAVSRLGVLLSAGAAAIALGPTMAFAQEVPATTNTPAADAIGPQALQNFSLHGTVTRAADQPAAVPPASQKQQPKASAQVARPAIEPSSSLADGQPAQADTAAPAAAPRRTQVAAAPSQTNRSPERTLAAVPQPAPSTPTLTATTVPALNAAAAPSPDASSSPPTTFAPAPPTPGTLAPEHGFAFLPWLLAAIALVMGGAFLFWRNRGRHAFAGAAGPQLQAFVAPETPAPAARWLPPQDAAPELAPAPQPKPSTGVPAGIVSTRLRPWMDIGFHPLRCILEKELMTVEFEIELFNSGSGPARAVLVEASLFNAGPTQDQEIGSFFANPVGQGERIPAIQPLKRLAFKTQIVIPIEHVRAYELGGRQVFVPLIAFNTLYEWGGGAGQTSAAFLLGRDTNGEKMAPFRLDLGPRIFRGLGSRLLPSAVRR